MTRRGPYQPTAVSIKNPKTTADRIKALRHRVGWTQKELAALLHIPHQAVGNWERGESKPMPHLAGQLELMFGQTEGAILEGTGFDLLKGPEMAAVGPIVIPAAGEAAIRLSHLRGGETEILSLESRRGKTFTSPLVMATIAQRIKENRPVWILIGSAEPEDNDPRSKARKPAPPRKTSRK